MAHRQNVLELLALGAVLGGRRDLLEELPQIVRTPQGRSLCRAVVAAAAGDADELYGWFRSELSVKLGDGHEKIVDAIVADMRETAQMVRDAEAGSRQYTDAVRALIRRGKE